MCIAVFALDHPDYALILAANRDEHLGRPTRPAAFHNAFGGPDVLSGLDVQAGGTWLGLSRTGNLALLTNITESDTFVGASRGNLVSSFLAAPRTALLDDPGRLFPRDASYAGFNLVLLAPRPATPLAFDALYVTNHGAGGPIVHRPLADDQRHRGVLSNGIDGADADTWPKVQQGIHALDDLLSTLPPSTSEDQLTERLLDLLTWQSSQPPRERSELKYTIQVDPVRLAHSIYATRLSTVVLVSRSGDVVFTERDRWMLTADDGPPVLADTSSQRVFRFKL